jgi:hypothetical protein
VEKTVSKYVPPQLPILLRPETWEADVVNKVSRQGGLLDAAGPGYAKMKDTAGDMKRAVTGAAYDLAGKLQQATRSALGNKPRKGGVIDRALNKDLSPPGDNRAMIQADAGHIYGILVQLRDYFNQVVKWRYFDWTRCLPSAGADDNTVKKIINAAKDEHTQHVHHLILMLRYLSQVAQVTAARWQKEKVRRELRWQAEKVAEVADDFADSLEFNSPRFKRIFGLMASRGESETESSSGATEFKETYRRICERYVDMVTSDACKKVFTVDKSLADLLGNVDSNKDKDSARTALRQYDQLLKTTFATAKSSSGEDKTNLERGVKEIADLMNEVKKLAE